MNQKLTQWESKKISPLPLENTKTILSWSFALSGVTIIFTGALQVFDFSSQNSFIFGFLVSLTSGATMWGVIKDLMKQVEKGTIREFDEYF